MGNLKDYLMKLMGMAKKRNTLFAVSIITIGVLLMAGLVFTLQAIEPPQSNSRLMNVDTTRALTFDPSLGRPAKITYTLKEKSIVRIRVKSREDEELVHRTLVNWAVQKKGKRTVSWDGRDASGNLINPKSCTISVNAEPPRNTTSQNNKDCRESCHNQYEEYKKYKNTKGDVNKDGKIDLSDLSEVIRLLGSKQGDKKFNPAADVNEDKRINLSDAAVVIRNYGKVSKPPDGGSCKNSDCHGRGENFSQNSDSSSQEHTHLHSTHDPKKCGDLTVHINSPTANQTLTGQVEILSFVDKKAQGYAEEYDIKYYLDYEQINFAYITNTTETNWTLDTTKYSDGNHMLTVSWCDHWDHLGSASIPIAIDNPEDWEVR